MRRQLFFKVCVFILAVIVQADIIDELGVHQWRELPNTAMSAVKPNPEPPGNTGFSCVIDGWSGGAFDTKRDRLIVWGGGHGDYSGNEIYAFDLKTLKWTRVTDPSPDVSGGEGTGEYPPWNGLIQPRSRHTYEYIEYLASTDRFCSFGAGSLYPNALNIGNMHCFDFETKKWERRPSAAGFGSGALSAYDPVTGHGWVKGTDRHSFLAEFIPDSGVAGKWFKRTFDSTDFFYQYYKTMDIDPPNRKLVAAGEGQVWYWVISNPGAVVQSLVTTTGGGPIVDGKAPGLAFDPVTGRILGWYGGQDVYALDVPARTWTRTAASGANPGSPNGNGTYGRFRYSPGRNVFVLVNSVNGNVFVYRHTPGTSATEVEEIRAAGPALFSDPTPFNSGIRFTLSNWPGNIRPSSVRIYNAAGGLVETLRFPAGNASVYWNAAGRVAGLYIARVLAGGLSATDRILLVR